MVRYELQRLPGAPLQRGTVDAGTTLVSLLDSLQLHRDVIVKLNGRALPDDYDISRPLRSGDVVAVFDQPEGGVGKLITTILRPVTKILSGALKVFGLTNKPSASVSVATGESPNNDLTGQTNRARLYKGCLSSSTITSNSRSGLKSVTAGTPFPRSATRNRTSAAWREPVLRFITRVT